MPNTEHEALLKKGVDAWNDWRRSNPEVRPDLRGVKLLNVVSVGDPPSGFAMRGTDLSGFNLSNADLSDACLVLADLEHADLRQARLDETDLTEANLSGAKLAEACLGGAKLTRARAQGADFSRGVLSNADLTEADLTEALLCQTELHHTVLRNANLRKAQFLDASCKFSDFGSAKLHAASFFRSTLNQCDFAEAEMPEASFIESTCLRSSFFFVKAHGARFADASLIGAAFIGADLTGARLQRSNLEGALLIRTDLRGADLSFARTYGASVWEIITDEKTVQNRLPVTPLDVEDEPSIFVDDIEVANFMHMLRDHKKLGKVINALTGRLVLLLGPFKDGGLERLRAVASQLNAQGPFSSQEYWPVIFDFDRPADRNLEEAAKVLVGLSKFVIADLGGPSVPHELAVYVRSFRVPFVPIIQEGKTPYALFESFEDEANMLPLVPYKDTDDLLKKVQSSILVPAEAKYKERHERLERKA